MTNYTRRALGNPSSDAVSITAISTKKDTLSMVSFYYNKKVIETA